MCDMGNVGSTVCEELARAMAGCTEFGTEMRAELTTAEVIRSCAAAIPEMRVRSKQSEMWRAKAVKCTGPLVGAYRQGGGLVSGEMRAGLAASVLSRRSLASKMYGTHLSPKLAHDAAKGTDGDEHRGRSASFATNLLKPA